MKLAEKLKAISSDRDTIILGMKTRIEEHLVEASSRGSITMNYRFLTNDHGIRQDIMDWLDEEGLNAVYTQDLNICITWNREFDRVKELERRIDTLIRNRPNDGYITTKVPSPIKTTDVESVIGNLEERGYTCLYDVFARELTVIWDK